MEWRVTHELRTPIPVTRKLDGYPALGVRFEFNAAGDLVALTHEVCADSAIEPSEVVAESERQLAILFEVIEFYYGFTPVFAVQRAQNLTAAGRPRTTGIATLPGRGLRLISFIISGILPNPERSKLLPLTRALPASDPWK